jgi:plastocyanin
MRTTSSRICGALAALALAATLAACGSSSASTSAATKSAAAESTGAKTPSAPAAHRLALTISGYAFKPVSVTVAVGSRITFTNHDATAHTATSNQPAFDTGTLKPGKSGTVTLKHAGTYTYYCQFHAFMHGRVIVK